MTRSATTATLTRPPVIKRASVAKPGKPSRWIWVPFIWLFFASTRTVSTWLLWDRQGRSNQADSSGSLVDQVLMTLLIVLGLYVLSSRAEQTKKILAKNKWVVGLFVYMGLSVIWSNFPGISLRRDIRSTGALVMVLVVLTEREPLEAIRTLLRWVFLIHISLSVWTIKFARNIGVVYNWSGLEEQWIGLSTDKNSLGQVVMCSGLFWLWQILQDWPKKKLTVSLLVLGMSLWLLRGSKNVHSSTAILGFVVCATLLLFCLQPLRKRAGRAKRIILMAASAAVLLAPLVYVVFDAFNTTPTQAVLQASGRDVTLTDRTLLWADLLSNAEKNPVLGVGIGAFWVGTIGYEMYPLPNWSRKTPQWRPEEGHNGFLDVYVELGAVGLVLLLIVIGVGIFGALDDLKNNFALGTLRLTLMLAILMNNISETSFLKGTHDLWFLFLLVSVNIPRPKRRRSLEKRVTSSDTWSGEDELPLHTKEAPSFPVLKSPEDSPALDKSLVHWRAMPAVGNL